MSGDLSRAEPVSVEGLEEPELLDAWRGLAEDRSNPFLTPEWYSAWLATHPDEEAFAIVWRVGGQVRGLLPLVRVAVGPLHLLCFAGSARGDWFTPACRVEDEREMAVACAQVLAQKRRSWQLLRFDRIATESDWPQALWDGDAGGGIGSSRSRREVVLPYIRFDEGGYASYLAARSRNFRSQLGRRRRKLEREHGLSFRMTAEAASLEADLGHFFRLHEERWLRRGGSSALSADAKAMHREFAAAALERGWLRLWIAEADGRPAAAWYGWRFGERYCYSLSGLGREYEAHGLGTVLLAHTIEQAAAEGAAVYDLLWGDEDYKQRFETGRRSATSWVVGRRRHPARAATRAAESLRRGASRLPAPAKRAYRAIRGS